MKITVRRIESMAIEQFAERNDLEMIVKERPASMNLPRYYAVFKNSGILDRGAVGGGAGNGNTVEEAIRDYAQYLSTYAGGELVKDMRAIPYEIIKLPQLT